MWVLAILTSRADVMATAILTSRSDVRATKDLRGGRHTPSMKEGWLCRTSCDEKNHEIAHMMVTGGDLDRAMIQIQLWWLQEIQIEWWSRSSSDDPDRVMIQIQQWWSRSSDDPNPVQWCWSRSSDDLDPVMPYLWWSRSRDDPDPDDLKMKMTWRWRWLRWSSWCREEDQCWKLCRKNTFLVKRECWCICNFGMYFIYCNPMFIPGCFYYVFESCGYALMFRSGGLIM